MNRFSFFPSPERTALVDIGIRQALANSLTAVQREAASAGFIWPGNIEAWCRSLLETRHAPPSLWCRYHDIVRSIVRDEAIPLQLAGSLMSELPAPAPRLGEVLTISRECLGEDAERYRSVIDNDPAYPLALQPATPAELARVARLEASSRALLKHAAPDLLDEIDTFGHQIVLATNQDQGFGGAATVFLWGAVILNPDRVPDRVTLIESLAHETAHALLFGMTLGADLTTNDATERYASPLRPDPRPIEGIVHATYVLARMNYALTMLLGSSALDKIERGLVETKVLRNRTFYEAGMRTVDAYARFTAEGVSIMTACRDAMAGRQH